jgi:phage tail-like protein
MGVTITSSIGRLSTDPLRNFKFQVNFSNQSIMGTGTLGFMSVSGLNITTEVIPYREGGMNTTTQKMPGQSDFAPITLAKGLAVGDSQMMQWMKQLFTVMQGTGTGSPGYDFRANMDILIMDHPVTSTTNVPVKGAFRVYNAWPTAIAFSDLSAGDNAIVIQQMTLAHEGFDFVLADSIGTQSVDNAFPA